MLETRCRRRWAASQRRVDRGTEGWRSCRQRIL